MARKVEINDIVYVICNDYGLLGKVIDFFNDDVAKINGVGYTDKDGNQTESFLGTFGVSTEDVFSSAADAYDAIRKKHDELVQKYCDEIKTVEDLVNFPLEHCLIGEEYTEYEAVDAYKIMVQKLLNISVND